jgi:hypothetical protein
MREAAIIVRRGTCNFIGTRWQPFIMMARAESANQSATCIAAVVAKSRHYQIETWQRN